MQPKIDWDAPEPRKGLLGEWDTFVGPGATRAEVILITAFGLLSAAALFFYERTGNLGWCDRCLIFALLLAFDLGGGVIANATSATKRWYHRPGQTFKDHLSFIAFHAVHLFVVAYAFRWQDWLWGGVFFALLIGSTLILEAVPTYLQRPIATGLFIIALLVNLYILPPTPGMEWFIPVFFLKLVIGHLVQEEPYRPA